ncbi:MAG TPA: DUF1572 family protein [Thermoanaerobaculia bacterium]|jgi:hypothetical protein|nr:DUF1572 family protein [Thermoanaerobaculia bacterium]
MTSIETLYLKDVPDQFRKLKVLADRAVAQVRDEDLFTPLDPGAEESNSLAVLLQHMGGNLRSRFAGFLTSDGEKPDRDRDSEFEVRPETTRADLLARWEEGWSTLFTALAGLTEADLAKTVTIRAEEHSVVRALDRALSHAAYHTGQIVLLAKHFAAAGWKNLSVPKGGTTAFNERMFGR